MKRTRKVIAFLIIIRGFSALIKYYVGKSCDNYAASILVGCMPSLTSLLHWNKRRKNTAHDSKYAEAKARRG